MNNYANWELTQLLPEINPYKSELFVEQQDWYLDIEQTDRFIHLGEYPDTEYEFIRNAWSWEDIRLYLESKGFSININHYVLQDIPYWCHVVNSIDRNSQDIGKFDTYEEAREEAIKYCLTKIKNG